MYLLHYTLFPFQSTIDQRTSEDHSTSKAEPGRGQSNSAAAPLLAPNFHSLIVRNHIRSPRRHYTRTGREKHWRRIQMLIVMATHKRQEYVSPPVVIRSKYEKRSEAFVNRGIFVRFGNIDMTAPDMCMNEHAKPTLRHSDFYVLHTFAKLRFRSTLSAAERICLHTHVSV